MENESIIFAIIGFIIAIVITRAIFSIPKMLRYQRAVIKLLALNAKKIGADEKEVNSIVIDADKDFQYDPTCNPEMKKD